MQKGITMNTEMLISGYGARMALVLMAGLLAVGAAQARSNPVDPVSNPNRLDYSDVNMRKPQYDEPFQRDGVVSRPQVFLQIGPGMLATDVEGLIGKPIAQSSGSRGDEWDYNFKFVMPQSQNYLVCQYKVILDAAQQVRETVWRRHQCLDIVKTAAASQ